MSYETWDWEQFKSVAFPDSGTGLRIFEPERYDPICMNESEAGYMETSPDNVRGIWIFRFEFLKIIPPAYRWMVDFYNTVRGGQHFLWGWPFAMADTPDPPEAIPGGLSPWNTEIEVGGGEGPVHLVHWLQPKFPVRRLATKNNYFETSGVIELRQV